MHGLLSLYLIRKHQIQQNILRYVSVKRNTNLRRLKFSRNYTVRKKRSVWHKQGRTDQWWINMYYIYDDDADWMKNFRMKKSEFDKLCEELEPSILPNLTSHGHICHI